MAATVNVLAAIISALTNAGTLCVFQRPVTPAGTLTIPGVINGKKVSYTVISIILKGGADGDVQEVDYGGALGAQSIVFTSPEQLAGGFSTNFGTDWLIKSGSGTDLLATVYCTVQISPGA